MNSVTQSINAGAPSLFNTFLDPSGAKFLKSGRIGAEGYRGAISEAIAWILTFKYDFRGVPSVNGVMTKGSATFFPYSISYTAVISGDYPSNNNSERCVEYGFALTDGNKLILVSWLSFTNSTGTIGELLHEWSWNVDTKDHAQLMSYNTKYGIMQLGKTDCNYLYGAGLVAVSCKIQTPCDTIQCATS